MKRTRISDFPILGEPPGEKLNWDSDEEEFASPPKKQKASVDEDEIQPSPTIFNMDENEVVYECDVEIDRAMINVYLSSAAFQNWARIYYCHFKNWLPRHYMNKDENKFKNSTDEEEFINWIQSPEDDEFQQMLHQWNTANKSKAKFGHSCQSTKNPFITEFICPLNTDVQNDPTFYSSLIIKYYLERKNFNGNPYLQTTLLNIDDEIRSDFGEWLQGDYDETDTNWDHAIENWLKHTKCTPIIGEDKSIPKSFEKFIAESIIFYFFFFYFLIKNLKILRL